MWLCSYEKRAHSLPLSSNRAFGTAAESCLRKVDSQRGDSLSLAREGAPRLGKERKKKEEGKRTFVNVELS